MAFQKERRGLQEKLVVPFVFNREVTTCGRKYSVTWCNDSCGFGGT
jgi:hypothetical protein